MVYENGRATSHLSPTQIPIYQHFAVYPNQPPGGSSSEASAGASSVSTTFHPMENPHKRFPFAVK